MSATPLLARGAAGRFAGLSRAGALAVVAALVLLIGGGWAVSDGGASPAAATRHAPGESDMALYRAIIARMRAGDSYSHAVVVEQRARSYPLRPIVAIRPPTLATLIRWLPGEAWAGLCLQLLAGLTLVLLTLRMERDLGSFPALVVSVFLLATGFTAPLMGEGAWLFHETWAGVLICLSLALRTERRYVASALIAGLAVSFRELALPFVLVMTAAAALEGRRREALAFAAAAAASLVYLAVTWWLASQLVTPSDPVSPGWVRFSGWRFVLDTNGWNALVAGGGLAGGPGLRVALAATLVPLAWLGAADWRGSGPRLPAALIGYMAGFMVIGRPNNDYWGLLTTPLTALGLAMAPWALQALWRSIAADVRAASAGAQRGAISAGPCPPDP